MLQYALAIVGLTLLSGLLPQLVTSQSSVRRLLHFGGMTLSGLASIGLFVAVLVTDQSDNLELRMGLPWLHWNLQLDMLSAFFFLIVGLVVTASSIYGYGYCRQYDSYPHKLTMLIVFTSLYVAAMQLVLIANDAFAFMVAWELMSLASYFLVAFNHQKAPTRKAAFLYLLMAHLGGLAILLSFGVMAAFADSFAFSAMKEVSLTPLWASVAFGLALLGFGAKAGLVPMHLWLPEAHPVAPSHISALLSAAIVKIALYGFIRISFYLLGDIQWQWGVAVLFIGSLTAIYGVLYALLQTDLKRMLAYSTIENMGVIFTGLGLAMIFSGYGFDKLGALALIAALYHALNHACFKGLMFMGAGGVLHSTGDTSLDKLGGLIRFMPWTALLFLTGSLAIASLPPLNGFVSEWLTFQAALQAASLNGGVIRATIPIAAAILALTAALGAACFVKAYGIAFLGLPRSKQASQSHESDRSMLIGQAILALCCVALGILPTYVVDIIGKVSTLLLGHGFPGSSGGSWLWLTPMDADRASYGAPLVFIGISLALLMWYSIYLKLKKQRVEKPVPRVPTWDCGFGPLDAHTQYTAESFSMPMQRIFEPILDIEESIESYSQEDGQSIRNREYNLVVKDSFDRWLYQPVANLVDKASKRITIIQTGHLHHYLLYSFVTLIFLLWFMP